VITADSYRPSPADGSIVRPEKSLVVALPPGDALFGRFVQRLVTNVGAGPAAVRSTRLSVRRLYPRADLHRQTGVAVRGRPTDVWIAYRDGRRTTSLEADGDGGNGPAVSLVFDAAGRMLEGTGRKIQNPGVAGRSMTSGDRGPSIRDILPSATLGDLVDPKGLLARRGELRGAWTGSGSSTNSVPTRYRVLHDGAGSGRHLLELRDGIGRADEASHAALVRSSLGVVDQTQRDRLIGTARLRELAVGDRLTETFVEDEWVVLVVSGLVRLHIVADGTEPTITYGTAGRLFESDCVGGPAAPPLGLQAMSASTLLLLDPTAVRAATRLCQRAAEGLAEGSRRLLGDALGLYAARTSWSLPRRLAGEIIRLRACQSASTLVVVTEQQLADGMGSIRESVARAIAMLRSRGWLATTRHGLLVLDPRALDRMANEPG
jgi:CRP/FNR family transcriptional regulator, cyclic AMP receptor protein